MDMKSYVGTVSSRVEGFIEVGMKSINTNWDSHNLLSLFQYHGYRCTIASRCMHDNHCWFWDESPSGPSPIYCPLNVLKCDQLPFLLAAYSELLCMVTFTLYNASFLLERKRS